MANLVRSRGYGRVKPPVGARINWSHPLAAGLIVCCPLNEMAGRPFNLVNGYGPSALGTVAWSRGGTYNATSTTSMYATFTDPAVANLATIGESTIIAEAIWNGSSADFGGIAALTDSSDNPISVLQGFGGNFASINAATNFATGLQQGRVTSYVMRNSTSATAHTLDGIYDRTGSSFESVSAGNTAFTGAAKFKVHAERTATQSFPGVVVYAYLWNRRLTKNEARWVVAEPYAFIAPPGPSILYIDLGAATVATVALAGVASATATARAPAASLAPTGGNASATGTGRSPAASLAPAGGLASATGTGRSPAASIAPNSGNASGTGTARAPAASLAPVGGLASATGTASAPAASLAPAGGLASATGTARAPAGSVAPPSGVASATGTVPAPAGSVASSGGPASATATAQSPASSLATAAGSASATGTARAPSLSIIITGGVATAVGTAWPATAAGTTNRDIDYYLGAPETSWWVGAPEVSWHAGPAETPWHLGPPIT